MHVNHNKNSTGEKRAPSNYPNVINASRQQIGPEVLAREGVRQPPKELGVVVCVPLVEEVLRGEDDQAGEDAWLEARLVQEDEVEVAWYVGGWLGGFDVWMCL